MQFQDFALEAHDCTITCPASSVTVEMALPLGLSKILKTATFGSRLLSFHGAVISTCFALLDTKRKVSVFVLLYLLYKSTNTDTC